MKLFKKYGKKLLLFKGTIPMSTEKISVLLGLAEMNMAIEIRNMDGKLTI